MSLQSHVLFRSQPFRISDADKGENMSEAGNWCLIESDPGVFTELVQKFGVSGVQVKHQIILDHPESHMNLFTWSKDLSPFLQ